VLVIHDGGKQDLFFAGRTDAGHPGVGIGLSKEHVCGFVGIFAPQMNRRAQLCFFLIDPQVNWLFRSPGKNNRIVPGAL